MPVRHLSPLERAQRSDAIFFRNNPGRSIRVRASAPGEPANGDKDWPLMVVFRAYTGELDRRALRGDRRNVPDEESFLWMIWHQVTAREEVMGRQGITEIGSLTHGVMLLASGANRP